MEINSKNNEFMNIRIGGFYLFGNLAQFVQERLEI